MDLPTIIAQIATTAAQSAPAAMDLTKDISLGGHIANVCTNIAKGMWGGKVDVHPPQWFPPVCAAVFGVVGIGLAFVMRGANLLDGQWIAAALGLGVTATAGTAIGVASVHSAVRPAPPPPPPAPKVGETCPTCGQAMGGAPWIGSAMPLKDSAPSPLSPSGALPSGPGPVVGGKG